MDVHPTKNGINRYWSIPIFYPGIWGSIKHHSPKKGGLSFALPPYSLFFLAKISDIIKGLFYFRVPACKSWFSLPQVPSHPFPLWERFKRLPLWTSQTSLWLRQSIWTSMFLGFPSGKFRSWTPKAWNPLRYKCRVHELTGIPLSSLVEDVASFRRSPLANDRFMGVRALLIPTDISEAYCVQNRPIFGWNPNFDWLTKPLRSFKSAMIQPISFTETSSRPLCHPK